MMNANVSPVRANRWRVLYPAAWLHGLWIDWLLLHPRTNAEIRAWLSGSLLPCPTEPELNHRRQGWCPPTDLSIHRPRDPETAAFLKRIGMYRAALNYAEPLAAFPILDMVRTREFVETGLLLHVPHIDLACAVGDVFGTPMKAETVTTYARLFFRTRLFTPTLLRVAVEARVRFGLVGVGSPKVSAKTLDRAVEDDPRVRASLLPAAATRAQWLEMVSYMGYDARSLRVCAS